MLRPRVAHRKLARSVNYKQGIQCWSSNWQGFVSQVRNEQNSTRHTEVLKSSLRCLKPNTALQSSLRQGSNHCKTPNHAVPEQGAAPRHTHSLDPNRRPYMTERLHFTQDNTATHSFQLVFRVQSHDARRCVNSNSNRKTAMKFTNLKTQNASHTEWLHTNCSAIP